MCQVSDKMKFCTCSPAERKTLENGWIFHRYVGEKEISILGSTTMPADWTNPKLSEINYEMLTKRLNEPDAFDVKLRANELDRLEIFFTPPPGTGEPLQYVFEYKDGEWGKAPWEPFDLQNYYKRRTSGKIDNAFG